MYPHFPLNINCIHLIPEHILTIFYIGHIYLYTPGNNIKRPNHCKFIRRYKFERECGTAQWCQCLHNKIENRQTISNSEWPSKGGFSRGGLRIRAPLLEKLPINWTFPPPPPNTIIFHALPSAFFPREILPKA